MGLSIKGLRANHGDCFLFKESDEGITFIVDCGLKVTYKQQITKFTDKAHFIILTHIDEDHILGAIPLIEDVPNKFSINKVYLNSSQLISSVESHGNISVKQAKTVERLLQEKQIPCLTLIQGEKLKITKELSLDIISPTKSNLQLLYEKKFREKDDSDRETNISVNSSEQSVADLVVKKDDFLKIESDIVNACSIAFILNYKEKKLLYLSDAHPEVISDYLENLGHTVNNKIKVDLVKLSHHGSSKNISKRLLGLISCSNYWISTNGGNAKSKHPSPITLAKIAVLCSKGDSEFITFYFNHTVESIEARNGSLMTPKDKIKYNVLFREIDGVKW